MNPSSNSASLPFSQFHPVKGHPRKVPLIDISGAVLGTDESVTPVPVLRGPVIPNQGKEDPEVHPHGLLSVW